uniref:Essential MCU regulator, mitochondrial n=1 Tax=Parastrongyloides trichosuri TaxID=131310 RepID=A0A0N5A3H4_PARTI
MFRILGNLSLKTFKNSPTTKNERFYSKNYRQDTTIVSPPPFLVSMSSLKFLAAISFSLYFGSMIAKYGASFLEENEIFVPSDDDDDE